MTRLGGKKIPQYIKHPLRAKARQAVAYAVTSGKLPKAKTQICACGAPAMDWHHHNGYEEEHWLDVVAVCRKCHRKAEPRMKRTGTKQARYYLTQAQLTAHQMAAEKLGLSVVQLVQLAIEELVESTGIDWPDDFYDMRVRDERRRQESDNE